MISLTSKKNPFWMPHKLLRCCRFTTIYFICYSHPKQFISDRPCRITIMHEEGRIDDQNVHASYFNQCNIVHIYVDAMLMGKSIFNYIDSTTEQPSCLLSNVRNVSMKKQTKTCTLGLDVIHITGYKKPGFMALKIIAWSAAIITGGYIGMLPKR